MYIYPKAGVSFALASILLLSACGGGEEAPKPADTVAEYDAGTASPETPVSDSLVEAANEEGALLIYGSPNEEQMQPLIAKFNEKYPDIQVNYLAIGGPETFQRYLSEEATGGNTADIILESSPLLWNDFVERGEVENYTDPNMANLPDYADLAPGVAAMSMDPVVALFNKKLLPEDEQPTSLAELADVADDYSGKIGTYNIENSLGNQATYTYLDANGDEGWYVLKKLGPHVLSEDSAGTLVQKLNQGAYVATYQMSGAVRALSATDNADVLNFRYLTDDTPMLPRAMGITEGAASPNAAKVFYNYVLSVEGQSEACETGFTPYRDGVDCPFGVQAIQADIGDKELTFGDFDQTETEHEELVAKWNGIFN